MTSCFGCFRAWREDDQKLHEQRLKAFKELEDIQAGVGTSPAPNDVWGPDIAAKLTKKVDKAECETDGHSNPETASSLDDERISQQQTTADGPAATATAVSVTLCATDGEQTTQRSSDRADPTAVFQPEDPTQTATGPAAVQNTAPTMAVALSLSALPPAPRLCNGATDNACRTRSEQPAAYGQHRAPRGAAVAADATRGVNDSLPALACAKVFGETAITHHTSPLADKAAHCAGAGVSVGGTSIASAGGVSMANCSSGGVGSSSSSGSANSSLGGCGLSNCRCARLAADASGSEGGGSGQCLVCGRALMCRGRPQSPTPPHGAVALHGSCSAAPCLGAPLQQLTARSLEQSPAAASGKPAALAAPDGGTAGCGGDVGRGHAVSASASVCSASHAIGSGVVSSSCYTASTMGSGAAGAASPSSISCVPAAGRDVGSGSGPAGSCAGSRSSSTASAAASAAAGGGLAVTPTSERGGGAGQPPLEDFNVRREGAERNLELSEQLGAELHAHDAGFTTRPSASDQRGGAAIPISARPSAGAFVTPNKATPPMTASKQARSPTSSRYGWGGGGGGAVAAAASYYHAGGLAAMHKPSGPSPQHNIGSGGRGSSSRAGAGGVGVGAAASAAHSGAGAGRQSYSPCVGSFGGATGSGSHRGGGGGSRFTAVGAASVGFAGGRNTPPLPGPGVFTSASTRLALHDVLHHRSTRGLGGARGGRSGFSVSGLANVDFRPAWRY